MKISPQLLDHPKFLRLKLELAALDPTINALEVLLRIWGYSETSRHGEWWPGADADYLEAICRWSGKPGKLAETLTKPLGRLSPFVVLNGEGARVSGWDVHNAGLHHAWTAKSDRRRKKPENPPVSEPASGDASDDSSHDNSDDASDGISPSGAVINPVMRRGEGSRVEGSRVEYREGDCAGARDCAELPSEEEIEAAATAYAGSPARGVPASIPPGWLHMWSQTFLSRALRNPRGWRHALARDFEADYQGRKPLATGQTTAANGTARRPAFAASQPTPTLATR